MSEIENGEGELRQNAKAFQPPKDKSDGKPQTVEQLMDEAGLGTLTDESSPEEISQAVNNFYGLIEGEDPVLTGIVQSRLIDRLKDLKIKKAGDLVSRLFKEKGPDANTGQGQDITFDDLEPWPDPVNGADLLDEIAEIFKRFVVLPEHGETPLALWVLHTYALEAVYVSPFMIFESPEKRCGKTTGLNVLKILVKNPIPTSNISPAALFRSVEKFQPTLLLDEADAFLRYREELRGILNAGHSRNSAYIVRTVGEDHDPKRFSTWCPKAIGAIGKLPGTIEDRGIILQMRRKTAGEKVERLREDRLDQFKSIQQKAVRWVQDNMEYLKFIDPEVPGELNDRAADNWRGLLGIATLAGRNWPEKAMSAATHICGSRTEEDGPAIMLLSDIRSMFEKEGVDRLASSEIVKNLEVMEDRPWPEYRKNGKPITPRQIAKLLSRFGIKPKNIRTELGVQKGYEVSQFTDAFTRYLPDPSATTATFTQNKELNNSQSATEEADVAEESLSNHNQIKAVAVVADKTQGSSEKMGDPQQEFFVEEEL